MSINIEFLLEFVPIQSKKHLWTFLDVAWRCGLQTTFHVITKVFSRDEVRAVFMVFALCTGTLSCWNRKGPSPNWCHKGGNRFCKMHLYVLLALPFTGTKGSKPWTTAPDHYPSSTNLYGRQRSPGVHQIQIRPSDCQIVNHDSSLQRTWFHFSRIIFSCYTLQHSLILLCVVYPLSCFTKFHELTCSKGGIPSQYHSESHWPLQSDLFCTTSAYLWRSHGYVLGFMHLLAKGVTILFPCKFGHRVYIDKKIMT